MARIRTVKPEFFRHERLFELEMKTHLPVRLAFIGLWTAADREGRFKWEPRALKLDCLPFDDCDFSQVLEALALHGFIGCYQAKDGRKFGHIPSWKLHQVINNREAASILPSPEDAQTLRCTGQDQDHHVPHAHDREEPVPLANPTREARVIHPCATALEAAQAEGKGKEGNKEKNEEGKSPSANQAYGGTRLPANWVLPDDWSTWAKECRPDLNPAEVALQFADYWHSVAGAKARKADWLAVWRNWVRNQKASMAHQVETNYQRAMRTRMAEAVPAIARPAPGSDCKNPTDFFNTIEVPARTMERLS